MKKLSTLMIMSALLSTTAFAQDHIKCELKIPDNDVGCFMSLINCPEKVLKESKQEFHFTINEGEQLSGRINFNQIVLHPGTKKQDKNKIYVFDKDLRHENLRSEKDIDLVAFESEHGINYLIKKENQFVDFHFESPSMNVDYSIQGQIGFKTYVLTPVSAVAISCDKVNKEVFDAGERKRKAIEEHLKSKKKEKEEAKTAVKA